MRDQRIDLAGSINELTKLVHRPLTARIKETMEAKAAEEAAGDLYAAKLIATSRTSIEIKDWWRLFDREGAITRSEFLDGLRPNVEAIRRILSEANYRRIAVMEPGPAQLRIERASREPVDMLAELRALTEHVQREAT